MDGRETETFSVGDRIQGRKKKTWSPGRNDKANADGKTAAVAFDDGDYREYQRLKQLKREHNHVPPIPNEKDLVITPDHKPVSDPSYTTMTVRHEFPIAPPCCWVTMPDNVGGMACTAQELKQIKSMAAGSLGSCATPDLCCLLNCLLCFGEKVHCWRDGDAEAAKLLEKKLQSRSGNLLPHLHPHLLPHLRQRC